MSTEIYRVEYYDEEGNLITKHFHTLEEAEAEKQRLQSRGIENVEIYKG
ncbi:hypothetical protein BMG_6113 (plasmid) [Priestia megaterium]|nr:hypothetical protein [Priestia megaterium]QLK09340.1 hypothetical protein BMG_6113 [Priestia megaterium]